MVCYCAALPFVAHIAVHVAVIFDDKNKLLIIIRSALIVFAARLIVGFGCEVRSAAITLKEVQNQLTVVLTTPPRIMIT